MALLSGRPFVRSFVSSTLEGDAAMGCDGPSLEEGGGGATHVVKSSVTRCERRYVHLPSQAVSIQT